jgi:membrane fusion protein (multidrug efflux system)
VNIAFIEIFAETKADSLHLSACVHLHLSATSELLPERDNPPVRPMTSKIFLVLLATVAGLSACEKADEAVATAPPIIAIPVETVTAESVPFVDMVEVAGVVEPIYEVQVSAEAPGRVLAAPFIEGEKIVKGQLLLRVDGESNTAQISLLQSQLSTAQREFDRTKQLAKQGLSTPQQLDQAAAAVDGASLSIKQAKVGLGKTNVRSPITGYVAQKFAEVGEYVGPGAPLAHIVDYDTVKVMASVPESDVRFITPDKEVEIWIPALDKSFKGKVFRRSIVATRTFPVEIHVPNESLEILPGMRASVVVPRKDYGAIVVVPRDAILEGFNRQEAMVLGEASGTDFKAELRAVELGPAKGANVAVLSGLKAGEKLIVKGHRSLADGTKVRVVNAAATAEPVAEAKTAEPVAEAK